MLDSFKAKYSKTKLKHIKSGTIHKLTVSCLRGIHEKKDFHFTK